uniref:Uncharacterized protein n=1 Tax=Romanomermis culicivorax TaxID=13658 RepID=A0A915JX67_ROMCU
MEKIFAVGSEKTTGHGRRPIDNTGKINYLYCKYLCNPGAASQCESKKTTTRPLAALAPSKRALIRPWRSVLRTNLTKEPNFFQTYDSNFEPNSSGKRS